MQRLSKIQITAVFLEQEMGKNVFTQFYRDLCGGRHAGAHPDGHQHGGRKRTEISVTEFCYKTVNLCF